MRDERPRVTDVRVRTPRGGGHVDREGSSTCGCRYRGGLLGVGGTVGRTDTSEGHGTGHLYLKDKRKNRTTTPSFPLTRKFRGLWSFNQTFQYTQTGSTPYGRSHKDVRIPRWPKWNIILIPLSPLVTTPATPHDEQFKGKLVYYFLPTVLLPPWTGEILRSSFCGPRPSVEEQFPELRWSTRHYTYLCNYNGPSKRYFLVSEHQEPSPDLPPPTQGKSLLSEGQPGPTYLD